LGLSVIGFPLVGGNGRSSAKVKGFRSIDTDAQAEGHRSVVLKLHVRVGWFVSPTILTHVSSGKPV
jgi:hypothetical protein